MFYSYITLHNASKEPPAFSGNIMNPTSKLMKQASNKSVMFAQILIVCKYRKSCVLEIETKISFWGDRLIKKLKTSDCDNARLLTHPTPKKNNTVILGERRMQERRELEQFS